MKEVILPLVLKMECTATESEMNGNVAATIERGYQPFAPLLCSTSGSVSICGAGPSLGDTLDKLTGDVFAINSAAGFLLERGIVPRWAMIWDCAEMCEKFAVPHPDVTYLIGSRCHPKVFERLRDCNVIVWHAAGDHNIDQYLGSKNVDEPLVRGGTAGVTRAIYVAYALGYRDFHLFGADSSYRDGKTHIAGSLVQEQRITVEVGGRRFESTPQYCAQVEEIKMIYPLFKHGGLGAEMHAYDDGMLGWVLSLMKKDEPSAFANAIYMAEEQRRGAGVVAGVPAGTIKDLAGRGHQQAINATKTLQPLEERAA